MRKKIKDIQAGDILYMVNEGTSVGYLRIEAYRAKTGLIKQGKVPDLYYIELENMLPLHVHKMQFDETSLGFIFTDLNDAKDHYLSKVDAVLKKLHEEISELAPKLEKLVNAQKQIMSDAQELYWESKYPEEYAEIVEKELGSFKVTKFYDD